MCIRNGNFKQNSTNIFIKIIFIIKKFIRMMELVDMIDLESILCEGEGSSPSFDNDYNTR